MNDRLEALAADLRKHSAASVHLDLATRLLYSTDASSYQILPLAVVIPRHDDDVLATVEACIQLGLPMLPRGGGSSLAGQTVGEAVVIDFSKHLDAVIRIDGRRRRALVQPGITLDALNRQLAPHGLMVGPDPASSDRATIGGIIGNNSTGSHSIGYGMMADHIISLRTVLADGHETRLSPIPCAEARKLSEGDSFEAGVYRQLIALTQANATLIDTQFPTYWRRSGGYNLDALRQQLDQDSVNLAKLLAGSEGTLGIVLEAELDLAPVPRHKALAVIAYGSADEAFRAVPGLLELGPSAIEFIDDVLLGLARAGPRWRDRLTFVDGEPSALFVVEFAGEDDRFVASRLAALDRHLTRTHHPGAATPITDRAGQANVWAVRKAGLSLLASMRGDAKPTPGIEDVAVPPERLADYMAELRALLDGRGVASAMYAHASAGCIHVRPILNLKTAVGVAALVELTAAAAGLAKKYGGVPSSEHGDGLARSFLNPDFFGPEIYGLFQQVKSLFDPDHLFNPGKIVDAQPPDRHLRYGPAYHTIPIEPIWLGTSGGSFAQAVEMCNGAAVCRKLDTGTMCPSFMVLRDEKHSTRGRANLLRSALTGDLPGGLLNPDLAEALDLCLGCKACKTECPSSVDMTQLKAEAYAQKYRQQRPPLAARAFGNIDRLSALAAPVAPLANFMLRQGPARWLLDRALKLHPARTLPPFQRQSFSRRYRQLPLETLPDPSAQRSTVALFPDTFTEFNEPEQGLAAVRVLAAAGCAVAITPRRCCGRAALSNGLVPEARTRARDLVAALLPYAEAGIPVVGLEPSCVLTVRDDYPSLIPGSDSEQVAANIYLLDEYLAQQLAAGSIRLPLHAHRQRYLVHGHCHEKALIGTTPCLAVLNAIPGAKAEAIEAGCCGMAGAFGYAANHYDVSVAIARDRLIPAINANPGAILVANGVSCRHQIRDLTGRQALHLAEALAAVLVE